MGSRCRRPGGSGLAVAGISCSKSFRIVARVCTIPMPLCGGFVLCPGLCTLFKHRLLIYPVLNPCTVVELDGRLNGFDARRGLLILN